MNLSKSYEYFNPTRIDKVHIVGCGSVGSTVAELIARLGVQNFVLYDFDTVESHNIANQMFTNADIGKLKVDAVRDMLVGINPELSTTIELHPEGYTGQKLSGYVFLCVDNIDLRREICVKNKMNRLIKAMFDFRTRLTDGQHYAANWGDIGQVRDLIDTMDFSHEEAHEATPKTACGTELGVVTTVRMISAMGVQNFINFANGKEIRQHLFYDGGGFIEVYE